MVWIAEAIAIGLLIAATSRGAAAAAAEAGGDGTVPPPTCLASAHGAVPSATRYSTASLQAAIDACSSACGTVVVDAPGAYLTASLLITGCVRLHLPTGVSLLAGTARADYATTQPDWYLLHFRNCSGCALSGGGTVDGRARLWVLPQQAQSLPQLREPEAQQTGHGRAILPTQSLQHAAEAAGGRQLAGERRSGPSGSGLPPPRMPRKAVRNWRDASCSKPEECRPRLVGVVDSQHVDVTGVRLTDPVYWCLHVLRSSHVRVEGVAIRGDWDIPNNDGIDVDGSRHVSISAAEVDTADDAVCLKTTSPGHPLRHVVVRDCRLRSRSSAVKLGSESVADMRDVLFERLRIRDAHRGLAVQLRDGGSISNVTFRGITLTTRLYHPSWWGAAEPIYVTAVPRRQGVRVGTVSGLVFEDIRVTAAEAGILLAGGPLPPVPKGGVGAAPRARRRQLQQRGQERQRWWQPGDEQAPPPHSLRGIRLERVTLVLRRRTAWPGGCQDFRPSSNASSLLHPGGHGARGAASGGTPSHPLALAGGALDWWPAGLDCGGGGTPAVRVAGADDVLLADVQVRLTCPRRPDWRHHLRVDRGSTSGVQLCNVTVTADDCPPLALQ